MRRDYLLFQLYGPLASWGDVAVGEMRSTYDHPSKSGVLGMAAAALGIRREEEEKHKALAESYGFAVRLDAPGRLLRDYHTVQVPTGKRARDLLTRKDELAYESLTTIVSTRDYRCDALATVALWNRSEDPPWPLDEIGDAMQEPVFPLYLGRRACPLALPLNPQVVGADTLKEAFDQAAPDGRVAAHLPGGDTVRVYWGEHDAPGFEAVHATERWDQPKSRERWQFARRREHHATIDNSSNE